MHMGFGNRADGSHPGFLRLLPAVHRPAVKRAGTCAVIGWANASVKHEPILADQKAVS